MSEAPDRVGGGTELAATAEAAEAEALLLRNELREYDACRGALVESEAEVERLRAENERLRRALQGPE